MTARKLLGSSTRFLITAAILLGTGIFAVNLKVAKAQAPMMTIPQFMPVGSWNVEQTFLSEARSLRGIKLPCMMMNNYDNGYILRLSGGGGTFLAMAIDFKQDVFKQGRKYGAVVGLSNGYSNQTKATAFSESVLIFNVRPFSGFYQALQGAHSMVVDVEGNPSQFSLGNFAEAAQRLESCFGGVVPPLPIGAPVMPPIGGPAVATPVGMGNLPEPPAPDATASPRSGISKPPSWNSNVKSLPPSPALQNRSSASGMMWEAKAGDDLRMTLERWSNRAGVAVDWQSERGGQVVNDIRFAGSFGDAVQMLMAQNAAVMGLEANLMGTAPQSYGIPQQLTPMAVSSRTRSAPAAPPLGGGTGKWNAPAGSSLRHVLGIWSRQAGVELVWEANKGFAVKAPVISNGSYEEALEALLSQFVIDDVRPAVQLNNDPVSGRRMLLVQSTRI